MTPLFTTSPFNEMCVKLCQPSDSTLCWGSTGGFRSQRTAEQPKLMDNSVLGLFKHLRDSVNLERSLVRDGETTIKIFFLLLRAGALGAERKIAPKRLFSWETPRQYNFESANVIVEKFCCHCAGPYLGRGMWRNRSQWRTAPFHWTRARHSVNEGFGKEFHRKGNSVKRLGPFSELQDSENWEVAVLITFPKLHSYPLEGGSERDFLEVAFPSLFQRMLASSAFWESNLLEPPPPLPRRARCGQWQFSSSQSWKQGAIGLLRTMQRDR